MWLWDTRERSGEKPKEGEARWGIGLEQVWGGEIRRPQVSLQVCYIDLREPGSRGERASLPTISCIFITGGRAQTWLLLHFLICHFEHNSSFVPICRDLWIPWLPFHLHSCYTEERVITTNLCTSSSQSLLYFPCKQNLVKCCLESLNGFGLSCAVVFYVK